MESLADAAEWFIGVFQQGGEWFAGVVVGIVPTLLVLLTAVNALVSFIGQERLDRFAALAGKPGWQYTFIRYLALPVVAVFALTNPMAYTMGTFVPERNKAAFYDSAVSFVHPITGLFPHANAGELFVYLGIAAGITEARSRPGRPGDPVPARRDGRHLPARTRDAGHRRPDDGPA